MGVRHRGHRVLIINHRKELLRGLWVEGEGSGLRV